MRLLMKGGGLMMASGGRLAPRLLKPLLPGTVGGFHGSLGGLRLTLGVVDLLIVNLTSKPTATLAIRAAMLRKALSNLLVPNTLFSIALSDCSVVSELLNQSSSSMSEQGFNKNVTENIILKY